MSNTIISLIDNARDTAAKAVREVNNINYEAYSLEELLRFFKTLDDAYAAFDSVRKQLYHHLDNLDKAVVPTRLELAGCEDGIRIKFDDTVGYNFRRATKYSAKTLDKEALFSWLRERGDAGMITETVNAQTLANYLKDLTLNEGIDPPEGVAELTTYYGVGVNKYTPK